MRVWSLSRKDALEKEVATYSSILAWRIPWSLVGYESMALQRVWYNLASKQQHSQSWTLGCHRCLTENPVQSWELPVNSKPHCWAQDDLAALQDRVALWCAGLPQDSTGGGWWNETKAWCRGFVEEVENLAHQLLATVCLENAKTAFRCPRISAPWIS